MSYKNVMFMMVIVSVATQFVTAKQAAQERIPQERSGMSRRLSHSHRRLVVVGTACFPLRQSPVSPT